MNVAQEYLLEILKTSDKIFVGKDILVNASKLKEVKECYNKMMVEECRLCKE